jgi:hypothetical protein
MQIRRAYLRRSVKQARLQKRLLVTAMLAATGCAACLLQAEARNATPDAVAPAEARRIDPYPIVPGGVLREVGFALDGQNEEVQRFPLQSFTDGAGQGQAAFRNKGLERMALPGLPWHDGQAGLTLLKEPASNVDSGMADGSPAGAIGPAAGGSGDTSTGSSGDTMADGSGIVFTVVLAVLTILAMLPASPATPLTSRLRKRRASGAAAHQ